MRLTESVAFHFESRMKQIQQYTLRKKIPVCYVTKILNYSYHQVLNV